ncbi:MAG: DUF2905 domain-containing protein [Elusimicrobiota bacterium]
MFAQIGKFLIITGVVIVIIGIILILVPKIPFIGRLPGDIYVKKENYTIYFPLATCLLLSLILSLIFYLMGKR